jgi:hypothetical protein
VKNRLQGTGTCVLLSRSHFLRHRGTDLFRSLFIYVTNVSYIYNIYIYVCVCVSDMYIYIHILRIYVCDIWIIDILINIYRERYLNNIQEYIMHSCFFSMMAIITSISTASTTLYHPHTAPILTKDPDIFCLWKPIKRVQFGDGWFWYFWSMSMADVCFKKRSAKPHCYVL